MPISEDELMTVGDLRSKLASYSDDMKIFFGVEDLQFYRIKQRGEKLLQIEFNQTVTKNEDGEIVVISHDL